MSAPERTVVVRPRTVLTVVGILLGVTVVLWVAFATRGVLAWILIAIFLAMALNPLVEKLERRGVRRSRAALLAFFLAIVVIGGFGYLLTPPLVEQVGDFVDAVPDLVADLTRGEGPLGFLQTDYQIVDRIREVIRDQGVGSVLGFTDLGLSLAASVLRAVVGVLTIAFLTLFMLLEGGRIVSTLLGLLPDQTRPHWERSLNGVYRTVGGYVTGNVVISIIAGGISTAVFFAVGLPYAVPLGVLVGLFDLVPLAGASIAAVIVILVALATEGWVIALIVGVFLLVYQQLENHLLQPLIYGRTVQLSPLIVLVSVLIGADLAGILGALVAIPTAGSLIVIVNEVLEMRRERAQAVAASVETAAGEGG
jgi:predicted PurR-regulated permease PerM